MENKVKNSICLTSIIAIALILPSVLYGQGSWTAPIGSGGVEAIHMTSLHTGKVFVYSFRDGCCTSNFPARIFLPGNPTSGTTYNTGPSNNYFCAGHTVLPNGDFLMVDGEAFGNIGRFNTASETFTNPVGNTATSNDRWYPSTIVLGNGKIVTFGGNVPGGGNPQDLSAEIFDPDTNTSTCVNGCGNLMLFQDPDAYPRLILLSTQNANPNIFEIFNPGPDAESQFFTINTDNNTGSRTAGPIDSGAPGSGDSKGRLQGTYARFEDGRVMALGGLNFNESGETSTTALIDPEAASPSWSSGPSIPGGGNSYFLSTLLSDGRLLTYGIGTRTEIFNPVSNSWEGAANMSIGRGYHTSGVLLPDGKVIVSGGEGNGGSGEFGETDQIQIYSPNYLSAGARPSISSAPSTAGYGQVISVGYSSSSAITKVTLRRPGSSTHGFTYNMISVPVSFTDQGASLNVTIPSNPNLVPPGYYYLMIFRNSGSTLIPSVANWIQISGSGPPPDTDPPTPNPGTFASAPSADSDTAISMTATTGSDASPPIEYDFDETSGNAGGSDSPWLSSTNYTDTGLSPSTQYCYRTRSRDSLGNTGNWGSTSCATTQAAPDTTPPTPNPLTWTQTPSAVGDVAITMRSVLATDPSTPVEYQFDETSGNPGGTDSGWTQSETYFDFELQPATQYTYRVRARDGLGNIGNWSTSQSATTDPEDGNVDVSVGPGNTMIPQDLVINVGDSVQWTFMNDSHNVWSGVSGGHTVFDGDPPWDGTPSGGTMLFASTSDPLTLNATNSTFTALFDQAFLDASTGDAGVDKYNYHCHIHGSALHFGTITVLGGAGGGGINLESGVVSGVGSSWTTVNLSSSYNSMVVVATPNYDNTAPPGSVRIQNAVGSSFQVRVDAAGGATPSGVDVYFMVVEEGVYTQASDGVTMEAVKFTSTVTDNASATWNGETRSYNNTYTNPVVLGQVMTYNDAGHVEFWSHNGTRTTPPTASVLSVGKTVNEDPDNTHANETIGYIVMESGSGTMDGVNYSAGVTTDGVAGVTNAPPYARPVSGLSGSASVGIATLTAMDGNNGGWALFYGANPISNTNINLVIDEDQLGDTERAHTGEQVAYIVFEDQGGGGDTTPPTPNPATFASAPASGGTSSINMTATTGSDASPPVEYFFNETSGNPGGSDSTWQTSTSYSDTGLNASTQYCYTVQSRDSVGNTGTASSQSCATTDSAPDTNPPSSPSIASVVADSDSQITVTSTVSTDAEGSNPVEYQFNETTGGAGATDSGWQTSTTHVDGGLSASTQYCYQVRSRDSVGNTNSYSSSSCATTQGGGGGCTVVISDDFEGGTWASSNWNDGGTDCILSTSANGPQGTYSVNLQDDTSTSVTFSDDINLSAYQDVKVDFSYNPISFEGSEDFFLEISTNGGTSWSVLKQYVNDVDFSDTGGPQTDSVTSSGLSLTSTTTLRFRCDASGNADDVYIDQIVVSGCNGGGGGDTDPPTPNPATFASAPNADSDTAISMTATTASDASPPVEYNFNHVSGTPGGTDSGWQTSTSYTDSGLSASTQYCYTVQSRDSLGNTGTASSQSCATTQAGGGCGTTWNAQVNNTDGSISYSGMSNVSASGAFQNDAHFGNSGSTASFTINGNGVRLYVWRLDDLTQSCTVSIDGGPAQTVNVGTGPFDSFLAFEDTSLSCGSHTVLVTSTSEEFHVDAYQVRD